MSLLIMMRHGESEWNRRNQFTGWVDIPLSEKGVKEAIESSKLICHVPIDVIFTSFLSRAHVAMFLSMMNHSSEKVPIIKHESGSKMEEWGKIYSEEAQNLSIPVFPSIELNERMYGQLQGLNKTETEEKFGKDKVNMWRRSYEVPPPDGESLEMTAQRVIPYFENNIVPHLRDGRNVYICAHWNALRAIVMDLNGLSKEEILTLKIQPSMPFAYEFRHGSFTPIDLNSFTAAENLHE